MTATVVTAGPPGRLQALRYGLCVGCISFGGPAGQIGILHRELVEERRWLPGEEFERALNLCMLLPGPEALQLVIYRGWRWYGAVGGIVAGLCFLLPAALLLTGLSLGYLLYGRLAPVAAVIAGLQCVVVALVAQAVQRLAQRALGGWRQRLIALAAFAALALLQAPFLLVIVASGAAGALVLTPRPVAAVVAAPVAWQRTALCLGLGLGCWLLPWLLVAGERFGTRPPPLYLYFSKVALGGFGGAYAVLAYVNQELAGTLGWLGSGDLLAGVALAETTPGPLVLVLQFYGFVSGWHSQGPLSPAAAALLCSALASWAMFLPSFVLVIALAPYVERLRSNALLAAALEAVSAAVVAVLAVFALQVARKVLLPEGLWLPDWRATGLALGSWLVLTRTRLDLPWVLAGGAGLSLAARLLAG